MENLLVSTHWLAEHLHDDNIRIVDIRGRVLPASEPPPHYFSHHTDYVKSHIPNAVFIDWTTDIVEPESPTYDVANPERYAALMSRLGIGDEHTIIAYDDANGMFAARLWWTMLYYGHESVAVLDGGWQKWLSEGHSTTTEILQPTPATFTPKIRAEHLATIDDILATEPTLLDMRSPAEFNGEASRAQRKGHIPNAVNIPRKTLLSPDGTLKSREELRQQFTNAGIALDDSGIVTYCNSGVSAAYGLLALRFAGVQGGKNYDSSWKEWGNDPDKPLVHIGGSQ